MKASKVKVKILGVILALSVCVGTAEAGGVGVLAKLSQEIFQFVTIIHKLGSANSNIKEGLGQLQKLNDAMQKVSGAVKGLQEVKTIGQGSKDCMVILMSARRARANSPYLSIEEQNYLTEVEIQLIEMMTSEVSERINSVALNSRLKMSDAERYEIIRELSNRITVYREACLLHVHTQKRLEAENYRYKQNNDLALSLLYLR